MNNKILPQRPKRCLKCGKIISSWNKSGYCVSHASNEKKKLQKLAITKK